MSMKQTLMCLVILAAVSVADRTQADILEIHDIEVAFRLAPTIVDATVKDITKTGAAKIDIHKRLEGHKGTPTLIVGRQTCTPGIIPASQDIEKGARYILLLNGNELLAISYRAFKIRQKPGEMPGGKLECHVQEWVPVPGGGWTYVRNWVPLAEFEARIARASAKKSPSPIPAPAPARAPVPGATPVPID